MISVIDRSFRFFLRFFGISNKCLCSTIKGILTLDEFFFSSLAQLTRRERQQELAVSARILHRNMADAKIPADHFTGHRGLQAIRHAGRQVSCAGCSLSAESGETGNVCPAPVSSTQTLKAGQGPQLSHRCERGRSKD